MESAKEQLLNENRALAEGNLEKEPEMIERRGRINESSVEGVQLCSAIQAKFDEISKTINSLLEPRLTSLVLENKSGDLSEDTALALLQTSAAESEEESEKIIRQLLDGELPVDAFLESFMEIRKTMHMRKFKAEKMQELIRNPRPDATVPYPMGMIGGMPMPGMFPSY